MSLTKLDALRQTQHIMQVVNVTNTKIRLKCGWQLVNRCYLTRDH